MRKTLIYLSVLLVLAALVVFINQNKKQNAEVPPDHDFAVEDVSIIGRIRLTDRKGVTADLRREADHWKINGKYRVMPAKMNVLLETMEKVTISKYVSKARMEGVIKELASKSTKVEIFKKDENKPFKVYYVGGNTEDSEGTYMIMELKGKPANRPYIMYIPGMRGILDVRYFTDEEEWRDTKIFDHSPDEIAQVSLHYPENPEQSFHIKVLSEDSIIVSPRSEPPFPAGNLYKEGVKRYLSSFSFINAEAFDNENPVRDSVTASTPFVNLMLTDINGNSHQVVIYHMPLNRRSKLQYDQYGKKLPYDLDRYYAVINNGKDFVIIQDFVFGKLLKKYTDFFTPRKPL